MTTATDTPNLDEAIGDDVACALRLRPMWNAADVHPGYPATTETVVELARGNGFDVTVELLENWVRSGMVPDVLIRSGRHAWSPQNILTAIIQADTWRRWIPMDPRHLHKQTATELAEAQANAAGSTMFTDMDVFDVNAFLCVLARCDDRQMRQTFATAFKTKLRQIGVLDK